MKFMVFVHRHTHYLDDLPETPLVEFSTRFGKWQPTRPKLQKMLQAVQKLAQN